MKAKYLILFFLIYRVTSQAEAASWQHVTSAPDSGGFDVYVDVDSLQARADMREFWDKYVYKQEQEQEGKKFIEKWVYGRVNCTEKTRQYITVVGYGRNAERVFRYDVSPEWISIASDSKGEEVLKFVCGPPK